MAKKATRFGRLIRLGLILVLGTCTLAFGTSQAAGVNDLFAAVAMRVPAFAGIHVDEQQDTVYVHLRNGTPAMAQAILAELSIALEHQDLLQRRVQVVPATFGFSQLKSWHDQMAMDVLQHSGVTFIGIDHANNWLVIGVENSAVRSSVEPELASLRVPREAVNFMETGGPIEFNSTLRDLRRPVVGGIEIGTPFAFCSLGFNAQRLGVAGFVTASHCSNTDDIPPCKIGTVFTQPDDGVNRIGVETVRSKPHGCFCLAFGHLCAFNCITSDSAFVKLDRPTSAALGLIARPEEADGITAVWDGVSMFRLVGGRTPIIGDSVKRVGRTTGRKSGHVILAATVPVIKSFPFKGRILLEDQIFATYISVEGDSGGPVIHITGDGTDDALLEGIHWGFLPGVILSFFSPISSVQREIGPLTFMANSNPDLVAVSPPSTFCTDVGGRLRVAVSVGNVGGADARASITRVDFSPFGSLDVPTDRISQGGSVSLPLIDPTSLGACASGRDCTFLITVDANNDVDEGPGETNNTTAVSCPI
jgi:hypothetical protein